MKDKSEGPELESFNGLHPLAGQPQHNLEQAINGNVPATWLEEPNTPDSRFLLQQQKDGYRILLRLHRATKRGSAAAMNLFQSKLEDARNEAELRRAYAAYAPFAPASQPANVWPQLLFALAVIAAIIYFVFQNYSSAPAQDNLTAGWVSTICEKEVSNQLKAPSTAHFSSMFDAPPTQSGSTWRYLGTVDSENSFGASLRSSFTCTVSGLSVQNATVNVSLE